MAKFAIGERVEKAADQSGHPSPVSFEDLFECGYVSGSRGLHQRIIARGGRILEEWLDGGEIEFELALDALTSASDGLAS